MKLLFFDIDETLANGKDVPASAQEGIRITREKGNLVFICTGRNVKYVNANFSEYADGCICNNGRLAYYNNEVVFAAPIKQDLVAKIISILDDLEAGYVFHSLNRGYYGGAKEGFEFMKAVGDEGYLIDGFDMNEHEFYNYDIYFRNIEQRDRIKEALKDISVLNPHGPHPSADMTIIGVDKGDAIKAIAEKMNIAIDDTYAFGDGMNDINMLKAAGHGIAMGNGTDEAKAAADYITSDIDKDGIYNGLKYYGLI